LQPTVIATTRNAERRPMLERLGATQVLVGETARVADVLSIAPTGADAVLDLLGTATLRDSLAMSRTGGRVCIAGFLAGGHGLEKFDPSSSCRAECNSAHSPAPSPSARPAIHSARSRFQEFVRKAASGTYRAKPRESLTSTRSPPPTG
jgi:NADPH:quinone reductase-like Zn-dependent oxidoreductase